MPVEVAIEVPVEEPLEPPAPAAVEPLAPAEEPPPVGPSASYDGVQMTREQAARTLAWVNEADEQALRAGGVYGRGANIILEARPFATIEAFVATPYIGEKTVRAAYDAAN